LREVKLSLCHQDINKCFHLGTVEVLWKVIELIENNCLCNMMGSNDYIILPQHMVALLLEEYDEYYAEEHTGWFVG
jgi:hypothetical protein